MFHRYTSEQPFAGLTPHAMAELKCRSPPWRLVFPPGTPRDYQVRMYMQWIVCACHCSGHTSLQRAVSKMRL